jgi:hypothetical protein
MYKLCLLACLVLSVAAIAQPAPKYARVSPPAPKVVFLGDWITYNWASGFAANTNWVNRGSPGVAYFGVNSTSADVLASFQGDVVSLHPAMVHILIGQGDAAEIKDSNYQLVIPQFLINLHAVVQEAKAANIKVILGIEPATLGGNVQINAVIASYGAENNIPVINYGDALCGCVGSVTPIPNSDIGDDSYRQYGGGPYIAPPATRLPFPDDYPLVVTPAGYALMTQMAKTTIATMNLTLKSGWLQNVEQLNANEDNVSGPPPTSVNTVRPGAVVQFTPVGYFSDGSRHPFLNTNFQGASGTWTSSNPVVMYVNQDGLTWANSPGTAIIRYTAPSGISFSEWIMTVLVGEPG